MVSSEVCTVNCGPVAMPDATDDTKITRSGLNTWALMPDCQVQVLVLPLIPSRLRAGYYPVGTSLLICKLG